MLDELAVYTCMLVSISLIPSCCLAEVRSVLLYFTIPSATTSGSAFNAVIFYFYLMHNITKYYL